jgi:formamidopyrimidine-DNA glycosylase
MPELPDVEYFRQIFYHSSLNKEIIDIKSLDDKLLKGLKKEKLVSSLKNTKFITTDRHGKYLFVKNDNSKWLIFHFGMTGRFIYQSKKNDIPDNTKAYFEFKDSAISYICVRRLGKIFFVGSKDNFIEERNLGPDALNIDLKSFKQRIKGKRMIKSALMDQSTLAGIGNICADEILYQSKVHPGSKISDLDDEEIKKIFDKTIQVLKTAIDRKADVDEFPGYWIIARREENASCPGRCSGNIKKIKINSRSTYYCDSCQKKK